MQLIEGTEDFNGPGMAAACRYEGDVLWVLRLAIPHALFAYDANGALLESRDAPRARCLSAGPVALDAEAAVGGPDGRRAWVDGSDVFVDGAVIGAHDKSAWCIDWREELIATGGHDDRARLWRPDGTVVAEVKTNNVRAVHLADDGFLYTGGGSGRVHRWTLTGEPDGPVLHHEFEHGGDAGVQSVVVGDGVVYTWANDRRLRAWREGELLWAVQLDHHFSGTRALALGPGRLAVAGTHGPVAVFDLSGERLSKPGLDPSLAGLRFHPWTVHEGHLVKRDEDGGFLRRLSAGPVRVGRQVDDWLVATSHQGVSWHWLEPLQIEVLRTPCDEEVLDVDVCGPHTAVACGTRVRVFRTTDGAEIAERGFDAPGGVRFLGPDRLLVNTMKGLFTWALGGTAEALVTWPRCGERVLSDSGWPLEIEGSQVRFLGPDGNVWALDVGVDAKVPAVPPPGRPEPIDWASSTWAFAGRFGQIDKERAAERVIALGGRVAKSVTKKVTHLCIGMGINVWAERKVSSAEKKAQNAGLPVLTEADFLVAAAPDAEELRTWDGAALTHWRRSRPTGGMHQPLEVPALRGIVWPGAPLAGADLRYADLRGANLEGADLSGIQGERLDLRGANLRDAVLDGASLYLANLGDTDRTGASTEGTSWYGTLGID